MRFTEACKRIVARKNGPRSLPTIWYLPIRGKLSAHNHEEGVPRHAREQTVSVYEVQVPPVSAYSTPPGKIKPRLHNMISQVSACTSKQTA